MHPDGEPIAAAIDGLDAHSWRLPLPPLTASSIEPISTGEVPERDTLEAAAKLVKNHAAVARFAARGVGTVGRRPVSSPLSDPTATPRDEAVADVDAALRHVAHALLTGLDGKQSSSAALQARYRQCFCLQNE